MNRLFGVKKPKEEPKAPENVPSLGEASERVSILDLISGLILIICLIYSLTKE